MSIYESINVFLQDIYNFILDKHKILDQNIVWKSCKFLILDILPVIDFFYSLILNAIHKLDEFGVLDFLMAIYDKSKSHISDFINVNGPLVYNLYLDVQTFLNK